MTAETVYTRAVLIGRWVSMVFGVGILSLMCGALGAWLVASKHTPIMVQEPTVTHVEEDVDKQRLVNELQAMKVRHAKELETYKRLNANLAAQVQALTPRVNRVDDQIKVLNEAAQRTPPPMTDRELEEKTQRVLGIKGKVVGR